MKVGDWIQHKERQDDIYLITAIELSDEDSHPILYFRQWLKGSREGTRLNAVQSPLGFTEHPETFRVLDGGTVVSFTPIPGTFHQERGPTWAEKKRTEEGQYLEAEA